MPIASLRSTKNNGCKYCLSYMINSIFEKLPIARVRMAKSKTLVSVLELRRLLYDIKEKRPDICIHYRLLGELWITNFRSVILITEKGALFDDRILNKVYTLGDISTIMQFELDSRFQNYEPFFHYDVSLLPQY
jgi:hypothetical protein